MMETLNMILFILVRHSSNMHIEIWSEPVPSNSPFQEQLCMSSLKNEMIELIGLPKYITRMLMTNQLK